MSTEICAYAPPLEYYKITLVSHPEDNITAARQLRKVMNVSHKTALDMVKAMPYSFMATQFDVYEVAKNAKEQGFEVKVEYEPFPEKFTETGE